MTNFTVCDIVCTSTHSSLQWRGDTIQFYIILLLLPSLGALQTLGKLLLCAWFYHLDVTNIIIIIINVYVQLRR